MKERGQLCFNGRSLAGGLLFGAHCVSHGVGLSFVNMFIQSNGSTTRRNAAEGDEKKEERQEVEIKYRQQEQDECSYAAFSPSRATRLLPSGGGRDT